VEVHDSARKHDVVDEDIHHAIDNALAIEDAGEDPDLGWSSGLVAPATFWKWS